MRRAAALLVLPLLLVVACGDDTKTTETGGDPTSTTAPGQVEPGGIAIRISVGGGYSPRGLDFAAVPTVVLSDGTAFTVGPMTMQYPGPPVTPVLTGRLDERAVRDLLDAAKAAHLDEEHDYGTPGVTDMPSTTVQVELDGRRHEVSAYALSYPETGESDGGLTDEQRTARAELLAFVQRVSDTVSTVATDRYTPDAYQVEAYEAGDVVAAEGEPQPNDLDWPLAQPLADNRCAQVTGADAVALTRALEQATSITRWHSAGRTFTLAVKTVLPGTEPCPTA